MNCSKVDSTSEKNLGDYYYEKAEIDYYNKKYNSSFSLFNSSFQEFIAHKNPEKASRALAFQAIIQTIEGDYFGSEKTSTEALNLIQKSKISNDNLLVSIYNQIALNKEYQKDFASSTFWYELAEKKNKDPYNSLVILNNIAVGFYEQGKYDKAIIILKKINSKKIDSLELKARIIDNLSYVMFLKNKNYKAEKGLFVALKIREKEKDLWGQNASHAHLAEYFLEKNPEKSIYHSRKMFEIAKQLDSPDDQLEALQKLIALEPSEKSKFYFSKYQKINDSLQTARSKAKNQFALIRYETEKEKTENAQNKIKILNRNIALLSLFSTIIISIFWYRKRKKQTEREKELLKQEKEIEVKNTQLKYSKKVHDVVANGLYQTMVEIQNIDNLPKENLLDKLENLYEKSRDISNENPQEKTLNFSEKISEMLSSFSCEEIKVLIIGNNENYWKQLSEISKKELFYILRELMVNMKKHSLATAVVLKFEINNNIFSVKYTDNGVGIKDFEKKYGSGIQNTENRIAKINGDINFEKNPKGGLIVNMNIPL
ncbi:sensor histidine kinase [Cloacibacterium sp.]|uniref:sensor histidine kinase n=1 Tax=Cloacibacterium sp. TaxID=1913682 RepID=UPI0035B16866